ncbi:hypothetical protein Tco_0046983, partial [Tanacetum coccineum]
MEENMISNEFAVKLCLEHEVKRGHKVVKKELIVTLKGEIYFVKFIINPEEDDVEPEVVLERSFMRLTKGIADFGNGTIAIYPELDPFLDNIEGVEIPPFMWKIGKNSRNKRKQLEKYQLIYYDMGSSLSTGKLLTQEEAKKEALAIDTCRRYSLLEEERPVIKTMAYNDKYKKILDGICLDKMKLDGEIKKEEEEAIINIKGEALIEKKDPGVFVISVRLEGTRQRGGDRCKKRNNNVEPLNGRAYGASKGCPVLGVTTIIAKFLILDMPIARDTPILVGRGFLYTCAKTSLDTTESDSDDEEEYAIQINKFGPPIYGPKPAQYLNSNDPMNRYQALQAVLNLFRKVTILDICPRVEGVDFMNIPDDDTALTFSLILALRICPKKSRGKGSQGNKTVDDSQETIDVSEDSKPEPGPATKKTSSKRRVKNKVTLSADDNIISDDPNAALELAKSISQIEAKEAEAVRKVYATHARVVTESAKKKSGCKSSKSVVIQDTPSDPKSKPVTSKSKLKGAPSLTPTEQEAADIMQALKESKKTSKRQPGTGGSNEGTGSKPGVSDESTIVSATSSEGTGIKPWVLDKVKDITKEKVILEWGDEQDNEYSDDDNDDVEKDDKDGDADYEGIDHISDTQDADDEDVKTKFDEEYIYKYKICVRKDEDEEMINAEVDDSDKGDEEITDAAKADAKKTSEAKDDAKRLNSLHQAQAYFTVKDTTDSEINSLLEVKIQSEVPHTQSPSVLSVPVSMISEHMVPTPVHESPSTATTTTLPPLFVSTTPFVPQQTTTPIPTATITIDALTVTTAVPESNALTTSQVPSVVDNYLGYKVGDVFKKELKKHTTDLIQKYSLQQFSKSSKKQTPTVDLEQGSEKTASEILQIKREQAKKQHKPKFTIKSID